MDGPDPPSVSVSNPELAALLAAAYRDVDTLRKHVASLQKRADKGDRFAEVLHALGCVISPDSSPSSSPQGPSGANPPPATNGSANPTGDTPSTPTPAAPPALSLPPQFAQQLRQVVEMYEEKLAHMQGLLEESEARNKESWRQLDEIISSFQSHIHGARALARPYVDNVNPGLYTLGYTYTDSPTSAAFPSISPGVMGPPAPHGHGASSSTSSRHTHSGSGGSGSGSGSRALNATASTSTTTAIGPVAFPLPPHPPLPHSASASTSTTSLPHSHVGFQAPQHQAGGGAGAPTRRPRTPSMDNLYAIAQPPSKRSRAAAASMIEDKMRGLYDSYSTTASTNTGSQHHRPLGPSSTVPVPGSAFSDHQQHAQARIIDRKYRSPASSSSALGSGTTSYLAHPLSHSQSQTYAHISGSGGIRGSDRKDRNAGGRGVGSGSGRDGQGQGQEQGHSRSGSHSSASSMDVDEMIIKASTEGGDATTATGGVNGTPVGPGASTRAWGGEGSHLANAHAHSFLVGGQQHQQQQQQGYSTSSHHHHRRRSDRDRDLDSPAGAGGAGGAGGSAGAGGVNPYPGSGSGQSFNAGGGSGGSASASAMRVLGPAPSGSGEREGRSYTTVFAPVVTGAPTKKSKFPNSLGGSSASLDTLAGPSGSSSGALGQGQGAGNQQQQQPPKVPYPATNAKGERICRTCGIVGRYKDGKCVEKWGPGVMGPGTVCDRCRKKAKRDEGRQNLQQQQQQQLQPRSNSHAQLPLSQGSDRSIQRSDTILTNQPSSHSFIQSRNDRDPDSSPNLRSSTATNSATFVSSSNSRGTAGRHAPTPPTIASLREKHDDDDEDDDGGDNDGHPDGHTARGRDPEQLPMSNVGRGVAAVIAASSNNNSRSNSRNRRVRPGSAKPTPPATESSHRNNGSGLIGKKGSTSPGSAMIMDDEVDADADEDAEAEAEILGAVDAAAEGDGDDADGDGDGEGDLENDADADAELLEAVDAAEANSIGSSHGGDRSWLKSEPI